VLRPLADIRSDLVLPGETNTVSDLLADFKDSGAVVRFGGELVDRKMQTAGSAAFCRGLRSEVGS